MNGTFGWHQTARTWIFTLQFTLAAVALGQVARMMDLPGRAAAAPSVEAGDRGRQPADGQASAVARVVSVLRPYIDTWRPDEDPLVPVGSEVQVKRSNMSGIEVDGVRYYYRLMHSFNYDPKSRGGAGEYVPLTVLDAGTPWEVEIYRSR